jgi:hypothetical protein
METVEPTCIISRTDIEEPNLNNPNTEREEPKRAKLLRDIDEPRCRKSSTDIEDPNLENDRTDKVAPT